MAKKINYVKDIVDNYTTEDIIAFLDKGLAESVRMMSDAAEQQNLAKFGNVSTTLAEIWTITRALDEKLNGKKTNEVL